MSRTAAAAVTVAVLLVCVLVCAWGITHDGTTQQQPSVEQQDDVEDCDAEDFRNRETDCGFAPGTKPTTKTATRKPAPTKTTKTRTTKR